MYSSHNIFNKSVILFSILPMCTLLLHHVLNSKMETGMISKSILDDNVSYCKDTTTTSTQIKKDFSKLDNYTSFRISLGDIEDKYLKDSVSYPLIFEIEEQNYFWFYQRIVVPLSDIKKITKRLTCTDLKNLFDDLNKVYTQLNAIDFDDFKIFYDELKEEEFHITDYYKFNKKYTEIYNITKTNYEPY